MVRIQISADEVGDSIKPVRKGQEKVKYMNRSPQSGRQRVFAPTEFQRSCLTAVVAGLNAVARVAGSVV